MYTGARDPGHSVVARRRHRRAARSGLTYFFALSGFLLAAAVAARRRSTGRRGPAVGRYALHRAARLLPAYWFALVGAFLVLEGTGHPREAAPARAPGVRAVRAEPDRGDRRAAQPADVVAERGAELLRAAAAARAGRWSWLARRFGRAGRARRVRRCSWPSAWRGRWRARSSAWPETVFTSLPTYLPVFAVGMGAAALAHGRTVSPRRRRRGCSAPAVVVVVLNGVVAQRRDGARSGTSLLDLPAAFGLRARSSSPSSPGRCACSTPGRCGGSGRCRTACTCGTCRSCTSS